MPRPLTFEGPTLEAALNRVAEEVGADATIARAEKVRSGGVGGFFCKERFEVTVDDVAEPSDDAEADPPAHGSLLDLVDRVSAEEAAAATATTPRSGSRNGAETTPFPDPEPVLPSTSGAHFQAVMRRVATDAGLLAPEPPPGPVPGPEPDAFPTGAGTQKEVLAVAVEAVAVEAVAAELVALGLPEQLVPAGGADSIAVRLLRRLEELPEAPALPTTAGSVVAVVGDRQSVLHLASELAIEVGADPDDIVVAAARRSGQGTCITTAAAALDHRRSWRRRAHPTIVAVVAPNERAAAWATRILEALEPAAVWATVAADRKPDDVTRWLAALRPVDALAVDGVERTESPAAVLGLGVPVARVDGRRASPAAWTALLLDRLAA